jgi:hypothetical protein
MAEQKTKPSGISVKEFLNGIEAESKRNDCFSLLEIFTEVTGCQPEIWGRAIVGFGSYKYKYESGHSGIAPLTGFSPGKQHISIYLMPGVDAFSDEFARLGKFKSGKGCLYIKRLSDIDLNVLKVLIAESILTLRKRYPEN